jgi:hemerythrin-like domain-containing protein
MKRSPELTPLSHDHHQALFVAQQLRRAETLEPPRGDFLEFWRAHGQRHFAIEEEILLPAWIEGDSDAEAELAARLASEHLALRAAARRVERGTVGLDELRELGGLLERHVRFEERVLFPLIESRLDAEATARAGREIAAAEAEAPAG